jgi:hypothetical protein
MFCALALMAAKSAITIRITFFIVGLFLESPSAWAD